MEIFSSVGDFHLVKSNIVLLNHIDQLIKCTGNVSTNVCVNILSPSIWAALRVDGEWGLLNSCIWITVLRLN